MSRGLGAMQQRILDTLAWAAALDADDRPDGVVRLYGLRFRLPPWVYDLHVLRRYLGDDGQVGATRATQAAFTRAVRGLVARQVLLPCLDAVPARQVEDPHGRYASSRGYTPAEVAALEEVRLERLGFRDDLARRHVRFVLRRDPDD